MASRSDITPKLCRQLLEYFPETGELFWKARPASMFRESRWRHARRSPAWAANVFNMNNAGLEAFTATSRGYRVGAILGVNFPAQRVVWAIHHGEWPKGVVDHINGDRKDNRIANLRDVPHMVNQRNVGRKRNNTSGVTGVYWDTWTDKWAAQIKVNYKCHNLGRFDSLEDAAVARAKAEGRFGFHPHHGKRRSYSGG